MYNNIRSLPLVSEANPRRTDLVSEGANLVLDAKEGGRKSLAARRLRPSIM
jgi:hypothetical protein